MRDGILYCGHEPYGTEREAKRKEKTVGIKDEVKKIAADFGIDKIGFGSVERLTGIPSADPSYLLPDAATVISLVGVNDRDAIRAYLAKEDQVAYAADMTETYKRLFRTGRAIANYLSEKGHTSVNVVPNFSYRESKEPYDMVPDFSHRYSAVAAGVGLMGWSGNLMTPEYGSAVHLGSVLTAASIESDPMLGENPCDQCKLCVAACPPGFMSSNEEMSHNLGGMPFVTCKKAHNARCIICCAGMTGLSKNGKWSTWSPYRVDVPGSDEGLPELVDRERRRMVERGKVDPMIFLSGGDPRETKSLLPTCGNCGAICWEKREDREENYRLLTTSGVVVEREGGGVAVVKT
jgi:epoxyqueuosine reductase QueG